MNSIPAILLDHFLNSSLYRRGGSSGLDMRLFRKILNYHLRCYSSMKCVHLGGGYRIVDNKTLHDRFRAVALEKLNSIVSGSMVFVDTQGKTRDEVMLQLRRKVEID